MRKPAICLLAGLLTFSPVAAQQTFIVDKNGGGDFTSITAAVTAAMPDDLIRVQHGSYPGLTISKGVRILGEPRGEREDQIAFIDGNLLIRNLPRDQTLVLTDVQASAVTATDNPGDLFLSQVIAQFFITNCQYLSMHRCFARGPVVGARIHNSRVVDVRGMFLGTGGNGLVLNGADISLVESVIYGSSSGLSGTSAAILRDSRVSYSPGVRLVAGVGLFGHRGLSYELRGQNSALGAAHALIVEDDLAPASLGLQLETIEDAPYVLLAGSLARRPSASSAGPFYLGIPSIRLLFEGFLALGERREKIFDLPAGYLPNIHRRQGPFEPAPVGSRWLGIPMTFQAAVVDAAGKLSLSLPYSIVF